MSKAVMYTGWEGDFTQEDTGVTDVTIAVGLTGMYRLAFYGCKGLKYLSFLKNSTITTIGDHAFRESGIATLRGMEDVRKIGYAAFSNCKDLRTIEGLGCEEMGYFCFAHCALLQSMKGWPASMTVIPAQCFRNCTGMTTVDCDLSHVTSIGGTPWGGHAFAGCTSLLPPSLSQGHADPAAVLAFLQRKSKDERAAARYAIYASALRARSEEGQPRTSESPTPLAFALAKLPPDMARVVVEFARGAVRPPPPRVNA